MIILFFLSGPGRLPDGFPQADDGWLFNSLPEVLLACIMLAMLFSALFHFSERFREFWLHRVCAFMEKHGQKEGL